MPTKVKGTTGVDKIEAGAVITNPEFSGNATVTGTLTVNSTASINGSNLPQQFNFCNILINGDMQVAQRATSVASVSADGYYTCDRWYLDFLGSYSGVYTQSRDTDVPSEQGFASSLKMLCTTADTSLGAGDCLIFSQRVEGQNLQYLKKGTSSADSLTLSFWVKSNKTGTYITELYDSNNVRQISKSYTIDTANTWEKKTITFAGDTTGAFTNNNDSSLVVDFWLGAGSNYSSGTLNTSWAAVTNVNRAVGQVNLADATSNYLNITGIQLEAGTNASDFEFLPYDVQLARCQRYCYAMEGVNECVVGQMKTTTEVGFAISMPVLMRAAPSFSYSSVAGVLIQDGGSNRSGSSYNAGSSDHSVKGAFLDITMSGGTFTDNIAVKVRTNHSSGNNFIWSAEL